MLVLFCKGKESMGSSFWAAPNQCRRWVCDRAKSSGGWVVCSIRETSVSCFLPEDTLMIGKETWCWLSGQRIQATGEQYHGFKQTTCVTTDYNVYSIKCSARMKYGVRLFLRGFYQCAQHQKMCVLGTTVVLGEWHIKYCHEHAASMMLAGRNTGYF